MPVNVCRLWSQSPYLYKANGSEGAAKHRHQRVCKRISDNTFVASRVAMVSVKKASVATATVEQVHSCWQADITLYKLKRRATGPFAQTPCFLLQRTLRLHVFVKINCKVFPFSYRYSGYPLRSKR